MNISQITKLYDIAVIASSLLTITAITDLSVAREADAKRVGDCDGSDGSVSCSGGSGGRIVTDNDGSTSAGGSGGRAVCDGSECTIQGGSGRHIEDEDGSAQEGFGFRCQGDFGVGQTECVGSP